MQKETLHFITAAVMLFGVTSNASWAADGCISNLKCCHCQGSAASLTFCISPVLDCNQFCMQNHPGTNGHQSVACRATSPVVIANVTVTPPNSENR